VITLRKNITEIQNIYTYFEFVGFSSWENFEELLSISINQIKCEIIEQLDGIYSRHCVLKLNSFVFRLLYHEDIGNCLCHTNKQNDDYYKQLQHVANQILEVINT
jgi:hypothetical protein